MRHFIFLKVIPYFIFSLFFIFTGCSLKYPIVEAPEVEAVSVKIEEEMRKTIVANALKYLNKKDGRDCSGFVSLINSKNGEPYYKISELSNFFTNDYRSKAIYNVVKAGARITKKEIPQIADLIFFSDTLEKTKRNVGTTNITHVGIVTKIDEDGTIHFIHHSRGKNIMGAMNEKYPEVAKLKDKNINTYMKKCDPKKPKQECLSPFFFTAYGGIEKNFKL